MTPNFKSPRAQIRDRAEIILREARKPLHNLEIADLVLAQLGLKHTLSPKDVNTTLHDDPLGRFVRVGPGTWDLRR